MPNEPPTEQICDILRAPVRSQLAFGASRLRVTGKFSDTYISGGDAAERKRTDIYALMLDGGQEICAEYDGQRWQLWYSRFYKTLPNEAMPAAERRMRIFEKGSIRRQYSTGEAGNPYPSYAVGRKMRKEVFLGIGDESFDVWLSAKIEPSDVRLL